MFPAFHMGPAGNGRGLCDIDRALLRVTKSHVSESWEELGFLDLSYNQYIAVPGRPNFLTCDLVTPNNTLSMSHSPLAAGPIRNDENMKSLLVTGNRSRVLSLIHI